jgi:glyoxylase-like metal-dependent hydrolase (beta-lactamase superfamily II)
MPDYEISVGEVSVISLSDGTNEFPAANVFPSVSSDEWAKYPEAISKEGKLKTNFGCFILRSGGETILVDTGFGPDLPGRLPEDLVSKGIDPTEITIVAITHLHADHVGWNITTVEGNGKLTFPRARYLVAKQDWDHFRKPEVSKQAHYVESQVLPLEKHGVLSLMDGETKLTDHITMVPTPGHTPGHMSVAITSQGKRGFITGDVINFPFQAQETGWALAFDVDSKAAQRTRETVLEQLELEGTIVGAGHFLAPSFGRFLRSGNRRYWQAL